MMTVAPAAINDVVVRSSAPTWYSGPQASPRSALVKPNSMTCARFFHAKLAWVSITPLGRPVVPDVYINRCRSSAPVVTRGTVAEVVRTEASGVQSDPADDPTDIRARPSMSALAADPRGVNSSSQTNARA